MDDKDKKIALLSDELERAREREKDYRDARRAMVFMLEDLNAQTAEIAAARREWEATFDSIQDPVFIHDADMNITRANDAYSRLVGRPFKEIIGKPYHMVFPVMERPLEGCLKTIEGEDAGETELKADGRIFRMKFYAVRGTDGAHRHSVHVLEDVTEIRLSQKRLEDEMEVTASLLSVAEAVSGIRDMERLMGHVVKVAAKILGCEACLSYLKEKDHEGLAPAAAHGLESRDVPAFRTERLDERAWFMRDAIETKGPTVVAIEGKEHPFAWLGPASIIFVMPLAGRTGLSGVIIGVCGAKTEFSENYMNIAKGISRQVSIALDEARLFREATDRAIELSRRMETMKVMHEIDRSILSTLKSEEIMDTIVRLVARAVPCDRATIAVVDGEKKGFVYHAGFGVNLPKGTLVPFSDTSATAVVETASPQYAANILEEENPLPLEKAFLREGFVSHIRVPIIVKSEVAAVLSLGAKRAGAFTRDSIAVLESLASQMGVALENSRLISDLQALFLNTIKALSNAIDAKSPWTKGHSERVTGYAMGIGREMGLSEETLDDLRIAGLLHDIGKIGTYDEILNKPGRLTPEEYDVMKMHPSRGAEVLSPIKELGRIVPWIKHHHETYDGKGYPDGLKGENIPLEARILSVADTFDSMTAERPYRPTPGLDNAVEELRKFSGIQFDPGVVDAFARLLHKKKGPNGP